MQEQQGFTAFDELRRAPDFESENLKAYDASDKLILQTAAADLARADPQQVVVIGDRYGALTLGALTLDTATMSDTNMLRVFQDDLISEQALAQNAARLNLTETYKNLPLGAELLAGAKVVLLQLPKSLRELEEIADAVARYADPDVTLYAGGRIKHMSLKMNEVLNTYFGELHVSLAKQKSRVLTARAPKELSAQKLFPQKPFPQWGTDSDLSFKLASFGATFGGSKLDHGTRLLMEHVRAELPRIVSEAKIHTPQSMTDSPGAKIDSHGAKVHSPRARVVRAVDLGCGNGAIATWLALENESFEVIATDVSVGAINATKLTAQAAGVADRVTAIRANALEGVAPGDVVLEGDATGGDADEGTATEGTATEGTAAEGTQEGWADLVLLNPPFHTGSAINTQLAEHMTKSAALALREGGELWLVMNSHLGYRAMLSRVVGPTEQVARDTRFTVLRATKMMR